MKLLLDEMYPSAIAKELRARGYDVISVHETPGSGTADEDVFEHARSEGRAIVTENVRDYRPLAEMILTGGGSHDGLVFTTDKRWPRSNSGAILAGLETLLSATLDQPVDLEVWL